MVWAVGRTAKTEIGLDKAGIEVEDGFIKVDEYQQTTAKNTFALGDVCGRVQLTPVAIAAGRKCKIIVYIRYNISLPDNNISFSCYL